MPSTFSTLFGFDEVFSFNLYFFRTFLVLRILTTNFFLFSVLCKFSFTWGFPCLFSSLFCVILKYLIIFNCLVVKGMKITFKGPEYGLSAGGFVRSVRDIQ